MHAMSKQHGVGYMTPDHEKLLEEMSQHLTDQGYKIISSAYADVCDNESQAMLASMYSVASTYIRTRADRIAFNSHTGRCFEFDAKTNMTSHDNIFVEMLPVVSHYAVRKWFGLDTIYGCRWPNLARDDVGFVIDRAFVDLVETVLIFDRDHQREVNQWVEDMTPRVFPNAKIKRCGRGKGSGDPAIRVASQDSLNQMPHWRTVFDTPKE